MGKSNTHHLFDKLPELLKLIIQRNYGESCKEMLTIKVLSKLEDNIILEKHIELLQE